MINTIKSILEFNLSEDKKIELIKALVSDKKEQSFSGYAYTSNLVQPLSNGSITYSTPCTNHYKTNQI